MEKPQESQNQSQSQPNKLSKQDLERLEKLQRIRNEIHLKANRITKEINSDLPKLQLTGLTKNDIRFKSLVWQIAKLENFIETGLDFIAKEVDTLRGKK